MAKKSQLRVILDKDGTYARAFTRDFQEVTAAAEATTRVLMADYNERHHDLPSSINIKIDKCRSAEEYTITAYLADDDRPVLQVADENFQRHEDWKRNRPQPTLAFNELLKKEHSR